MITWHFHCLKHASHRQKQFIQAHAHKVQLDRWPSVSARSRVVVTGEAWPWLHSLHCWKRVGANQQLLFEKDKLNQASSWAQGVVGFKGHESRRWWKAAKIWWVSLLLVAIMADRGLQAARRILCTRGRN